MTRDRPCSVREGGPVVPGGDAAEALETVEAEINDIEAEINDVAATVGLSAVSL